MQRFWLVLGVFLQLVGPLFAGTISGRVTAAVGGAPLTNNISVQLLRESSPGIWMGGISSPTDLNGRYTFNGLEAGHYHARAYDWSGTYALQWYPDVPCSGCGESLDLEADGTFGNINFALKPAAHITGQVVDGAGQGLENIQVEAIAWYSEEWLGATIQVSSVMEVYTEIDGSFDVGGLPAGQYALRFSDWDGVYASEYWEDQYEEDLATRETLATGATRAGLNAVLGLGGRLSGVVRDADGVPLENIFVRAIRILPSWEYGNFYDYTTDTGAYEIGGLPPGTYILEVTDHNGVYAQTYYGGPDQFSATELTVTAGSVAGNLNITMQQGGTLSGTLTDSNGLAVAGIAARLMLIDPDSGLSETDTTYTGEDGLYEFQGVLPGTYFIRYHDWDGRFAMAYYPGGYSNMSTATRIDISAGEAHTNLNAVLLPGGSIAGRVTNAGGTPLADIGAQLWLADGEYLDWFDSVGTDADGRYVAGGLPPGSYAVEFEDWGAGVYASEYYDNKFSEMTATRLSLPPAGALTNVDAVLQVGATISGRVVDTNGNGLGDIGVSAKLWDGISWDNTVRWENSDETGAYTLGGLPAGRFLVRFYDWQSGAYAEQYYQGARSEFSATPVTVTEGQEVTNALVTMRAASAISGLVTNDTGQPLDDVYVGAYLHDAGEWIHFGGDYTGAEGRYRIDGLAAGEYVLNFWHHEYEEEYFLNSRDMQGATSVFVTEGTEAAGINAGLSVSTTDPDDGNSNGVPDSWERKHFGNTGWMTAGSDWDGDGFPDEHEFWAGTDPTNRSSTLDLGPVGQQPAGSGPIVRWPSVAGKFYRLERTTQLTQGFTGIKSNIPATPPMNTETDTTAVGVGVWYYRIGVERP